MRMATVTLHTRTIEIGPMESLYRFYIYARMHQLFSGDEEHTLVTLALVKEVVNGAHLKNHSLETLSCLS